MASIRRWAIQRFRGLTGQRQMALSLRTLNSIQAAVHRTTYRGVRTLKNPFDFVLYMRLLWELKPRTVIELGSQSGGSAMWMADQLRAYGIDGHIHSLDIEPVKIDTPPGVTFYVGDAHKPGDTFSLAWLAEQPRPLLVIDDADHSYQGVRITLDYFGPQMRSGEYIVVEDGNIDDLGLAYRFEGGPYRAIHEFLKSDRSFQIDRSYCDFYGRNLTWNVDGFLKKI